MTVPPPPPRTGLVLAERQVEDPRLTLEPGALILADRNGYPVVATAPSRRRDNGLLAGVAIALALGGVTFLSLAGHRTVPPVALRPTPTLVLPAARPSPVAVPTSPIFPPVAVTVPQRIVPLSPIIGAQPARAPIVVFDQSSAPLAPPVATPAAPREAAARPTSPQVFGGGNDNEQFTSRIGGSGSAEVATAQRLSDPAATITQGTLIPAVLETAIDTDLPGYVRALVAQDVRSFDGSRVLVPRSSRLIGQYKSGLAAGQTRAYVIWTRLIRPDGVSVALASPAVDFAGRSGLDGKVDSHFLKRFGSAALLSVVGGLASIGNSAVVLSGGQSAAAVAAQRDTSIPPTIRVPQGQPIRVFTARDLDFSGAADVAP